MVIQAINMRDIIITERKPGLEICFARLEIFGWNYLVNISLFICYKLHKKIAHESQQARI